MVFSQAMNQKMRIYYFSIISKTINLFIVMKKQVVFIALILGMGVFFGSTVQAQWNEGLGVTWTMDWVGIGTDDPDAQLHIRDEDRVDLFLTRPLTGNGPIGRFRIINEEDGNLFNMVVRRAAGQTEMIQSAFSSEHGWMEYAYFNYDTQKYMMRWGVKDAEFVNSGNILFNNSGSVGIGVSEGDANTKLEGVALGVNGTIKATELIVELYENWPDFVFADDYNLMSLYEVENYIKQNRHLPNVPSEAQVLENGVNVGEMTSILLQKVEELTLHIIELNKRIEELEK